VRDARSHVPKLPAFPASRHGPPKPSVDQEAHRQACSHEGQDARLPCWIRERRSHHRLVIAPAFFATQPVGHPRSHSQPMSYPYPELLPCSRVIRPPTIRPCTITSARLPRRDVPSRRQRCGYAPSAATGGRQTRPVRWTKGGGRSRSGGEPFLRRGGNASAARSDAAPSHAARHTSRSDRPARAG
jgi:hypothetical protein